MLIYKVTNTVNGKIYIGQTACGMEKRWKQHIGDAKGRRKKYALHNAINKYGSENFTIEEIDGANTLAELNYLEEHYIYKNNTLAPNGYNLRKGGNNSKMSISSCLKNSISSGGNAFIVFRINKKQGCNTSLKVLSKDKVGEWINQRVCATYLKLDSKNINACLKGKDISHKGYVFEYKSYILDNKRKEERNKRSIGNKRTFKVFKVLNNAKKTLEYVGKWNSQQQCSVDLRCNRSKINTCLHGKRNTTKGYAFKYCEK